MIQLTINNKNISVPEGTTILEAAKQNGILIPSLCYVENVHKIGSCRICSVEIEGRNNLQVACLIEVTEGMVVKTNSEKVLNARRSLYELMLSDHSKKCLSCDRNLTCELQKLGETLGIRENRFDSSSSQEKLDISVSITRDLSKCILCRRCVTACNNVQEVGILNAQFRGFKTTISPTMDLSIADSQVRCTYCGQCVIVCPVGALKETDAIERVWAAINDPEVRVVIQAAPAVRVALGEMFGYPVGTSVTGKMVAAMRALGCDDVFDTDWAADLTIIEEGTEFLNKLLDIFNSSDNTSASDSLDASKNELNTSASDSLAASDSLDASKNKDNKKTLPMITSCSPGWIKYIESYHPELLSHLSTCKSPHMMLGAVAKSHYAQKNNYDPKKMFVVSVMPCTAKKFEATREEMKSDDMFNVDAVLTTRELGTMIKQAGIDFCNLPDEQVDAPLGYSTGAADIFGLTGGVMEAALRTVYYIISGKNLPFDNLHVAPIMGLEKIKEASIKLENLLPEYKALEGAELRVAVASGFSAAKQIAKQIKQGISPYHFIEIMGCPGGCINGGGQPRSADPDYRKKRMQALYKEDEDKQVRQSHENPAIIEFYKDWGSSAGGDKSHKYLHTHYIDRSK